MKFVSKTDAIKMIFDGRIPKKQCSIYVDDLRISWAKRGKTGLERATEWYDINKRVKPKKIKKKSEKKVKKKSAKKPRKKSS